MVIISAAICDKSGGIILSRQFQNITKHQLEENMRNFPKLISQEQQHTFVETEYVRYLYLPIDSMYLVLLTKKNSNIIEDQETIRLLLKIVQELCVSGVSEANILKLDIEILLGFDDVISYGVRDSVTLTEVQKSLQMESAEEKLYIQLMKQKQAEQKEAAKRHQLEVEKRRTSSRNSAGVGNSNSISSSSYGSYSSSGATVSSSNVAGVLYTKADLLKNIKEDEDEGVYMPEENHINNSSKVHKVIPKKSLVLGKKGIKNNKESNSSLQPKQENVSAVQELKDQIVKENIKEIQPINPLKPPVEVEITEKISCQVSREGIVTQFDINGEVLLQFLDPAKSRVAIQFEHEDLKLTAMKPHINLDKQLWMDKKQIALKNIETQFPVNTRVPSLKYKYSSKSSKDLPFTATCWFSDGVFSLEIEFNAEQDRFEKIDNIVISFELPSGEVPYVSSPENAEHQVDGTTFKYIIPVLSRSTPTSSISIGLSMNITEEEIYPLDVNFTLPYTFFDIKPVAVANLADNMNLLKFEVLSKCLADKYQIN